MEESSQSQLRPPKDVSSLIEIRGQESLFSRHLVLGRKGDGSYKDTEGIENTPFGKVEVGVGSSGICSIKVLPGEEDVFVLKVGKDDSLSWERAVGEETVAYYSDPNALKDAYRQGGNVVYMEPVEVSGLLACGGSEYLLRMSVKGRTDEWAAEFEYYDVTKTIEASEVIPEL